MAEAAKVRLVRCPKCENLLPELTDYSVYQCGGCGAVLRAKNKNLVADTSSEKSDEERRTGEGSEKSFEKAENFNTSENQKVMNFNSPAPENDVKSIASSSSRASKKELLCDPPAEDNYRNELAMKSDKWVAESDLEMYNEREFDRRSVRSWDRKIGERSEYEGFRRGAQRNDFDGVRYSTTSKYPEEGPSNYHLGSTYGYGEPLNNRNDSNVFNRVEYLEQDRAVLLRKLDELRGQLNRSCEVVDKPKEKVVPTDRRMYLHDPYAGSENLNYMPDKHPYFSRYAEAPPPPPPPPAFAGRHGMPMHSYYDYPTNQAYGRHFSSQMPRRAPYFSSQYVDSSEMGHFGHFDQYEPYPHNIHLHPSSCSCLHCYRHSHIPPPILPTAFPDKILPDYNNPRIPNPPLNPHNPRSLPRWHGDIISRPPRVVIAAGSGSHSCRPISGGAPLVTCCNCFELLQLPKKLLLTDKRQKKKMRCGQCSTIMIIAISEKKLVVSIDLEAKTTPVRVGNSPNGHENWPSLNFSSDDYDNSGYDFHSMDKDNSCSGANKPAEVRNLHTTSSSTSDDEGSNKEISNFNEIPTKSTSSPPSAGSPLQEHFDYSTKFRAVNKLGKGNKSGRSESNSRQNSMKEASMATEIEISSNEYGNNTGTSQDSGVSRDGNSNKRGDSFFAGIIKKSFKDLSRSNQTVEQGQCSVTVNGHPMPDRLVKKAEKIAGPIQPGEYWYDFRAGFWGVVGGPCRGIIPPFIEEFNYPMPEKCAGGNTGVFVNGRELHEKDLELLGGRGLPTDRDRSYIIEISGRVLDEDSGEELESLGKLAPTVEKVKHGFGMKVPKVAA